MKLFRVVIWLKANEKREIKNAIEIAFGAMTAERAQVYEAENGVRVIAHDGDTIP